MAPELQQKGEPLRNQKIGAGRRSVITLAVTALVAGLGLAGTTPMPALGAGRPAGSSTRASVAALRTPLPTDRLHFGLQSDEGSQLTWLQTSNVPVKYRYQYLVDGVNTGGGNADPNCGANSGWQTWASPAGAFVTNYINDTVPSRIPVFTYYQIVPSNPAATSDATTDELTKITTLCTMQAYWADYTVLLKKVGAYGGQVVIQVEPDFWGNMEGANSDVTKIPADVASTSNTDLVGLPNTLQGMAWAYLKLRDKYAPNALLAIHVNNWQGGMDLSTDQSAPVSAGTTVANTVATWIKPAGFVGNPSGVSTWDLVFNDVADHDAASYNPTSDAHWWDKNNVLFPNFTRWLAFMTQLHMNLGVPLVVWQVPVGNQYFQTMNNTNGHYQDNRVEYFLAHPADLTAAGIVAVLIGKANSGQTNYWDDIGDGITNPASVVSWQCNLCNNHASVYSDDDGGYLRLFITAYYNGAASLAVSVGASPQAVDVGDSVSFTASPTGGLAPYAYSWNLGDGSTSTSPAVSHAYSATGLYTATLTLTDAHAATATASTMVTVSALPGVTAAASPTTGNAPLSVALSASPSGGSSPYGYSWNFGDGTGLATTQNPTHVYSSAGNYTAQVTLTDARGHGASSSVAVAVTMGSTPGPCASVTISAAPTSVSSGTHVTATATASGCPSPRYEFWLRPASSSVWQMVQAYGISNTYDWNSTGAAAGVVYLGVHAKDAGSTASADAYASAPVTVMTSSCASVTVSAAPTTVMGGTHVTATAAATGCTTSPRYEFWIRPASSGVWQMVQAYGTGNTYDWNSTGAAAGIVYIGVHAKDANSSASADAYASTPVTVTAAQCTGASVTAAPTTVVHSTSNGTHVTVTAVASGCTTSPRYEFWIRPAGSTTWYLVQGYGTSNTYDWNSTGAGVGTVYIGVHVRDANSTASADAYASTPVTVT